MIGRAASSNSRPARAKEYAPSRDLHRRKRRRSLLYLADEQGNRLPERWQIGNGRIFQLNCLGLDVVVRRATASQAKRRAIPLRHRLHPVDQPRGRADRHHQHAGGNRIERAGMAELRRRTSGLTLASAAAELIPAGLFRFKRPNNILSGR